MSTLTDAVRAALTGASSDDDAETPATPMRPLPPLPLAATGVHGNLVITARTVTAWYLIEPVPWSFRSTDARTQTINEAAVTLLELTGQPLHWRGTNRPYPIPRYAEALWRDSPAADRAEMRQYLVGLQRHLRHESLDDSEWYVGVQVLNRGGWQATAARTAGAALTAREHRRALAEATRVTDALAASTALRATPITQAEMDRLMYRSTGLGLPEPHAVIGTDAPADHADIAAYTDGVDVDPRVGSRVLRMRGHASHYGLDVERYTTVLSLGRTPDVLNIPEEHDPWVAWAQRLPFPVEWSIRAEVIPGAAAARTVNWKIKQMYDARASHRAAGVPEDELLAPALRDARRIESEMRNASLLQSTRVRAWLDIAVSGADVAEVERRAAAVVRHYERHGGQVIERGRAQEARYRAFVPGERLATTHHRRLMKVTTFAAAVPHVSAVIGDRTRRGTYYGHTQGHSRRIFVWAEHAAMEVYDRSGFTAIVGSLGSGKSVLQGLIASNTARRGIQTTILDPAGIMARLPGARHIDLARGRPGILCPYTVIPEPRRERLAEHPRVRKANPADREAVLDEVMAEERVAAEKRRMQLAIDILLGLLPRRMRGASEEHVRAAVYAVGGRRSSVLGSVLDRLGKQREKAAKAAHLQLVEMAGWPQVRLFYGTGEGMGADGDAVLTVITLAGVRLPVGADEAEWGDEERLGVVMLTAAAHYAAQRIYDKPMRERAVIALDEVKRLRYVESGRALLHHLARENRKHNTRVLAASQRATDFLELDVDGLLGESFIGHISPNAPRAEREAALRLVGVPEGYGYESTLSALSGGASRNGRGSKVREFLHADVHGNVEIVRIDGTHVPHVMAALDSTPEQDAAADPARRVWRDDEVFDPDDDLVSA